MTSSGLQHLSEEGKPFLCGGLAPKLTGLSPTLVLALVSGLAQDQGARLLQCSRTQLCLLPPRGQDTPEPRMGEPSSLALGRRLPCTPPSTARSPSWLHPQAAGTFLLVPASPMPTPGRPGEVTPAGPLPADRGQEVGEPLVQGPTGRLLDRGRARPLSVSKAPPSVLPFFPGFPCPSPSSFPHLDFHDGWLVSVFRAGRKLLNLPAQGFPISALPMLGAGHSLWWGPSCAFEHIEQHPWPLVTKC